MLILQSVVTFLLIKFEKLKDQRYYAIKSLIETKRIHGLQEIFNIIPLSVVRLDMKTNYSTLRKRIYNGNTLTAKDFILMGGLFEVDPSEILKLAIFDIEESDKNLKKKGKGK